MTNVPFDLETLGGDAKLCNDVSLSKQSEQQVSSPALRNKQDIRRRWIAGLVALLICLATVVVIVAIVKSVSVRHRIKEIRCDLKGA